MKGRNTTNAFFNEQNRIDDLMDMPWHPSQAYREVIDAYERTTYSSIYIIDYHTQRFEYVSDNPLFLCGHTAEEVQQMGYNFYYQQVTPEDLELLVKINQAGFSFLETLPIAERKSYTIAYDFHLNTDTGIILVHQKLTPLSLTSSGKIWKALCTVSLSTKKKAGNIHITQKGSNTIFAYDLAKNQWKPKVVLVLSDREKQILQLSIRGFTIQEIADKIYVTVDTVKFHRKNLYNKLAVSNMSEAILYAVNNRLL